MSDLKEYKCPACGGSIEFDSHLQKMKCPYCDTEFELDTLKEFDEQIKREASKFCNFFCDGSEYIIPYKCICKIGPDVILVEMHEKK